MSSWSACLIVAMHSVHKSNSGGGASPPHSESHLLAGKSSANNLCEDENAARMTQSRPPLCAVMPIDNAMSYKRKHSGTCECSPFQGDTSFVTDLRM